MDAAVIDQLYEAFGGFHAYFGPLFGRKESREHSRHYLQALLVETGERRKRRESVGDGSGVSPGDAAVPDRIPLGR